MQRRVRGARSGRLCYDRLPITTVFSIVATEAVWVWVIVIVVCGVGSPDWKATSRTAAIIELLRAVFRILSFIGNTPLANSNFAGGAVFT